MSTEAATRRPLRNRAADARVPAIDTRCPTTDANAVSDTVRSKPGLDRRLRCAAKQALRLMGED